MRLTTIWQVPVIAIQMFGATSTIGAFTFMSGTLLLTTFELYLVTVVGTIMSAFSALRITHSYGAQKMLSYAFSVGIKLMMLDLCIAVIQQLLVPSIQNWAAIPLLGSVMAGFSAIAASLIAYNASTFAAGIVTGMAQGNFAGTMAAVQGSIAGARGIAQGMVAMSQSTHDMSQAKTAEDDAKTTEQGKASHTTTADAQMPSKPADTSLSASQHPESARGTGSVSESGNGLGAGGNPSTTSVTAQGLAGTSDQGSASHSSSSASGGNSATSSQAANSSATTATPGANSGAPVSDQKAPWSQDVHDSPRLQTLKQHLAERYGPGSENLSSDQKNDLDKAIAKDKQGMQQDFAGGFNSVRDGMMGIIGKGQDQSVGAVQIRSSV